MPFHAATLMPQNRHCRAMMADWLKLRNRKKLQPAEVSMDPPEETTESTLTVYPSFNLETSRNNLKSLSGLLKVNIKDTAESADL